MSCPACGEVFDSVYLVANTALVGLILEIKVVNAENESHAAKIAKAVIGKALADVPLKQLMSPSRKVKCHCFSFPGWSLNAIDCSDFWRQGFYLRVEFALREHEVVELVNVQAVEDSFLYHVPCSRLTRLISEAVDIPLVSGVSFSHEDELTLLKTLLQGAEADGVVAGTIASNYQMSRLKKLCVELELKLYAPLWNKGSERLLRAMAGSMDIIVVQVAADGMNESWLGRKLDEGAVDDLSELHRNTGCTLWARAASTKHLFWTLLSLKGALK